jgi:hypothetical protein
MGIPAAVLARADDADPDFIVCHKVSSGWPDSIRENPRALDEGFRLVNVKESTGQPRPRPVASSFYRQVFFTPTAPSPMDEGLISLAQNLRTS